MHKKITSSQANPTSTPLISWYMMSFKTKNTLTIDPVLMFARGDVIYFFRVSFSLFTNCKVVDHEDVAPKSKKCVN